MGWSISPDSSWQRQITHLALFLPVCMLELHLRVTGPAAREDILIPVLLEELVQNSQSPTTRTYLPFSWMCITSRPLLPTVPHPPSCCCYCSYSNDHARKKKIILKHPDSSEPASGRLFWAEERLFPACSYCPSVLLGLPNAWGHPNR